MKHSDDKDKGTSKSRRSFLKKAGTAVVLTPPAMAMLSKPSSANMVRSATGQGDSHHHSGPSMKKKVAKKKVAKKKVSFKKKLATKKKVAVKKKAAVKKKVAKKVAGGHGAA